MPITSSSPDYIEAFVQVCYQQGLNSDETAQLFKTAHTLDLLANNSDFRAGWEEELQKSAETGAWEIATPAVKGTTWGAGLGAAAATIGTLLAARKNPMSVVKKLGLIGAGTAGSAGAGGLLGSAKSALPEWLGGSPALPSSNPYLPSWATPGSSESPSTGADSKTNFPISALSGYPVAGTGGAGSSGSKGRGRAPRPIRDMAAQNKQIADLGKQIHEARVEQGKIAPGRGSEVAYRGAARRIADLEGQRGAIIGQLAPAMGRFTREQGEATRSQNVYGHRLDRAQDYAGQRLDAAEDWMRTHRDGNWTQPSYWWGKLNGVEGRAEHLNSEVNQLEAMKRQLAEQRRSVAGPW